MDKKDYKKVFIIMSHDLTRGQVAKLKDMGGKEILLLPPALKELWGNIDAEGELDTQALLPVIHWIEGKARERDLVLIQGEHGATYYLVDYCFQRKLCPIYSSSKRVVQEIRDGEAVYTQRLFEHINFREYKRFET